MLSSRKLFGCQFAAMGLGVLVVGFVPFIATAESLSIDEFKALDNAKKEEAFQRVQEQLQDTQRDAQALQEAVVVSAAESKNAARQTQSIKEDAAEQQSAKLLKSGVTIGFSGALQFDIGSTNGTRHSHPKVVGMPYVVFLPAYWGKPEATRAYCASSWGSGDEDVAQAAAIAISRKRAVRLFSSMVDAIRAGADVNEIADRYVSSYGESGRKIVGQVSSWTKLDPKQQNQNQIDARREEITQWLSDQEWNPAKRGDCGWTKWGFWVGKPLNYRTGVKVRGEPIQEREFVSQLAWGGTFTPNAYVSLLLGVTIGTVEVPGAEGSARDPRIAWAGTFALGGNFDLAGAIFKTVQNAP